MVLLYREILVEESNVQRVDSPVTVSISVSITFITFNRIMQLWNQLFIYLICRSVEIYMGSFMI